MKIIAALIFLFNQMESFYYHEALPHYAECDQCHFEYVNF